MKCFSKKRKKTFFSIQHNSDFHLSSSCFAWGLQILAKHTLWNLWLLCNLPLYINYSTIYSLWGELLVIWMRLLTSSIKKGWNSVNCVLKCFLKQMERWGNSYFSCHKLWNARSGDGFFLCLDIFVNAAEKFLPVFFLNN